MKCKQENSVCICGKNDYCSIKQMTNEQWFCSLSTEEKARFLAVNKLNFDYQMWIEWLKQPHREE